MRKFGHRMTDAFINGAGHFATHGMGDWNIHVSGRQRGRHGFKAVADGNDYVGLEALEGRRQFDQADPGRFRHRCRCFALDQDM